MTGPRKGCIVCGGNIFKPVYTCTDHLVSGELFTIARCVTCGLLITGNAPETDDISRYYDSPDYVSHTGGKRSLTDLLYSTARFLMLRRKARIIKKVSKTKRGFLLDIGAGTGHFVGIMRKKGWKADGLEINESARKYALEKNNIILGDGLLSGKYADKVFDTITLWHVLEHIHEPGNHLKEINRILKPGGILIVALPNASSSDAAFYGHNWAAFDVPRHLWHFNNDNFNSFVTKYGFHQISVRKMPFDSFYIPILSERNVGKKLAILRGIARGLFFYSNSSFNIKNSSSLMYILEKDAEHQTDY